MKKFLTLIGVLALILCVSSCSGGYDGKKVVSILEQLEDGEIDDDAKTSEFLAKQLLAYEKEYNKEIIKIAKNCKTEKQFWRERDKMMEEKFPKVDKVFDYVYRHRDDIPELYQQIEDYEHSEEYEKLRDEFNLILKNLK